MIAPQTLKAAWSERLAQLLQTLHDWPWLETLQTLRQRFREDRLGLTASSLTFTTTIALVPLFTVMLALFTAFPVFGSFRKSLEHYFLKSLVPDTIAKPVMGALMQFAARADRIGTAGLIVLVLTAIALMLTIDRTLNGIWRVRNPRPIAQRVLVYWAAVTLGPLLLGVSLSLTSYAMSASRGLVSSMPGAVNLLLNGMEFALFWLAMAGLFHYVPNTHVRWRHALAGGIFVAVGIEVAKKLLAWYVAKVPTYSTMYGAFATLPIFLIWLYAAWVIVLLGAVVAAYAPSLQMRVVRRPSTPGHRFALALTLITELLRARAAGRAGTSLVDIAADLRTDPLQIEPVLDLLIELDWVGRLEEAGAQRYVLLVDPQSAPAEPLVARLLLTRGPVTEGFWRRAAMADMKLDDLLQR